MLLFKNIRSDIKMSNSIIPMSQHFLHAGGGAFGELLRDLPHAEQALGNVDTSFVAQATANFDLLGGTIGAPAQAAGQQASKTLEATGLNA